VVLVTTLISDSLSGKDVHKLDAEDDAEHDAAHDAEHDAE
jgi:hypothetical protein